MAARAWWNASGGFPLDLIVEKDYDESFVCGFCHKIIKNAHCNNCGHCFCVSCLQEATDTTRKNTSDVTSTCPHKDCDLNNMITSFTFHQAVWKDVAIGKALTVRCYNHKAGCTWQGKCIVKVYHHHLTVDCGYMPVMCYYECGTNLLRREQHDHERNECPLRPVTCSYCNTENIKYVDLEKHHRDDCRRLPKTCNACKTTDIPQEEMQKHVEQDCQYQPVKCMEPSCNAEGQSVILKKDYINHLNENPGLHMTAVIAYARRRGETGTDFESAIYQLLQDEVANLAMQLSLYTNRVGMNQLPYTYEEDHLPTSMNGRYMWIVRDWSTKLETAKRDLTYRIFCKPFYTSQFGYKLTAYLYPNGMDPSSRNTYMSLYLALLHGEYDSTLLWPFKPTVAKLIAQDQSSRGNHVTQTLSTTYTWPKARPNATMSPGFGSHMFVSHHDLDTNTNNLLLNDTLLIKMEVLSNY